MVNERAIWHPYNYVTYAIIAPRVVSQMIISHLVFSRKDGLVIQLYVQYLKVKAILLLIEKFAIQGPIYFFSESKL